MGRLISKALSYIEPTLGNREEEYRLSFLEADKEGFRRDSARVLACPGVYFQRLPFLWSKVANSGRCWLLDCFLWASP